MASIHARLPSFIRDRWSWAIPLGLVGYVIASGWTSHFPDWRGVPTPPTYLAFVGAGLLIARTRLPRVDAIAVTAVATLALMVMVDIALFSTQGLRDLELYVKAANRWLAGEAVYLTAPLSIKPTDLSDYPFLYPPMTLPAFAVLALLPFGVAATLWIVASIVLVLVGLRLIGLSWRWSLLMLAWPPVAQGLYVGNVAVPLFVLFAAAPWWPAGLLIAPIFKLYGAITALWLVLRRNWRQIAVGLGLVLAIAVLTLPIVTTELWAAWWVGLQQYQVSQGYLPDFLYGNGLARYIPGPVFVLLAIGVVALAAVERDDRRQLGRLGAATAAASPALYSHGLLVALPGLLRLDTKWLWLALGLTTSSHGEVWLAGLGLIVASWLEPALQRSPEPTPDPLHPLGSLTDPWPDGPGRQPSRATAGDRQIPGGGHQRAGSSQPAAVPLDRSLH